MKLLSKNKVEITQEIYGPDLGELKDASVVLIPSDPFRMVTTVTIDGVPVYTEDKRARITGHAEPLEQFIQWVEGYRPKVNAGEDDCRSAASSCWAGEHSSRITPAYVLDIETLIGGIVVVNASDSNSVEKISNAVEEALAAVMSRIHEPAELGNESKKSSNGRV